MQAGPTEANSSSTNSEEKKREKYKVKGQGTCGKIQENRRRFENFLLPFQLQLSSDSAANYDSKITPLYEQLKGNRELD